MSQDKNPSQKIEKPCIVLRGDGIVVKVNVNTHIPIEDLLSIMDRSGYAVTKKNSAVFTVEVQLKDPHVALSEEHQEQLAEMVKELKATVNDCRFEHDLAARIDVLIDGVSS